MDEARHDFSKDRLNRLLYKRVQASFIGALAVFEEEFGDLWGENEPEDQPLTKEQEEFDIRYEKVRKRILDNGNMQFRKMLEELKAFEVNWDKI